MRYALGDDPFARVASIGVPASNSVEFSQRSRVATSPPGDRGFAIPLDADRQQCLQWEDGAGRWSPTLEVVDLRRAVARPVEDHRRAQSGIPREGRPRRRILVDEALQRDAGPFLLLNAILIEDRIHEEVARRRSAPGDPRDRRPPDLQWSPKDFPLDHATPRPPRFAGSGRPPGWEIRDPAWVRAIGPRVGASCYTAPRGIPNRPAV